MGDTPAANDPIALPLAAQLAGIPARTLRNWVAGGKLAAIRGQRGWLVRMGDIGQIAALLGTDAASAAMAGGMAAESADDLAARGAGGGQGAANAANAAMVAAEQREQAEALVQRLLAPFIAELGAVREELGAVKAERDELRRRAEAAEARVAQLSNPTGMESDAANASPARVSTIVYSRGLRARLGRWWRGGD